MKTDDDPTQNLPDKDRTTQPTATAILERLQGFEARISQSVRGLGSTLESQIASLRDEMNTRFVEVHDEMNTRFAAVHDEMNTRFAEVSARFAEVDARFVEVNAHFAEIREDMNTHFGLVANKIEVMHEDNLNVRAGQRELMKRMAEIESKAS